MAIIMPDHTEDIESAEDAGWVIHWGVPPLATRIILGAVEYIIEAHSTIRNAYRLDPVL